MFGLVNNLTFTPDNVLLKTLQQNINGNVFISNKVANDHRILPLSFVDVQLESINGKILNEFYLNLVHKDDPLVSVNSRLEFHELLAVDYMQFYDEFNGFNLNELLNQVQLYQVVTNYSDHLHHMGVIGKAIVKELNSEFFDFYEKFTNFLFNSINCRKNKFHGNISTSASHIWGHKKNH